ncbi:hypothetical protein AUK11_00100 [bacterium CG2_30_37_16]|nr:MAG: hypothetical protein AUK11_00100 [bacterium CG2_30_37_16]PIP30579.1 MAG: hypothetical protein COX25_04005 [bacterium (Candidatus Howlettbacteria) CG23_combo_of_CG06-09_8_20_14_all_37_9]PIX99666.1 MAG: hypothetical protein COZ22_02030 [bacterium (Candidatus Howlettbacteria) CG_4_10_14_3_um_filter_37_10]PJB06488.1 MAG: hypothetical protein CO123_02085 [bacterium (Candidatus Howlettbacteria) CG_4_9_14_3_um_filter_37_10]
MKRLRITHPEITVESLRKELNSSPEKRKAVRILGILKVMEGKKIKDTSCFLECHRSSLPLWVQKVNKEGLKGFDEKDGRGLKSRLAGSEKDRLKDDLLRSPKDFGFSSNIWTGKILKEHLQVKYNITYKLANVYVLLKDIGFTLQRPTKKILGSRPKEQKEFKKKLKKNIKKSES